MLGELIMRRNCALHWKVSKFLVNCGKGLIRRSQVYTIFQFLLSIIEERHLASPDSQDIILCDMEMATLVGMPHLHLTQLKDAVLSMLVLKEPGQPISNPTDSYKNLLDRMFPQQPPPAPTIQHHLPEVQVVIQDTIRWKLDRDLSILLLGFESTEPVEFQFILDLFTRYISNKRDRLVHPKNLEIAYVRNDPLYAILGVSYIHRSQMRKLITDHVSPIFIG